MSVSPAVSGVLLTAVYDSLHLTFQVWICFFPLGAEASIPDTRIQFGHTDYISVSRKNSHACGSEKLCLGTAVL